MPSSEKPRVRCPWCGYDVTRIPRENVCPECGGRQSPSDFLFAERRERQSWRGVALLELLAPGIGLWIGIALNTLLHVVADRFVPLFPFAAWILVTVMLGLPKLTPERKTVLAVRQRQMRLFALTAFLSLLLSIGLGWGSLFLPSTATVASLARQSPLGAITGVHIMLILFGIGTGAIMTIPITRARRVYFERRD